MLHSAISPFPLRNWWFLFFSAIVRFFSKVSSAKIRVSSLVEEFWNKSKTMQTMKVKLHNYLTLHQMDQDCLIRFLGGWLQSFIFCFCINLMLVDLAIFHFFFFALVWCKWTSNNLFSVNRFCYLVSLSGHYTSWWKQVTIGRWIFKRSHSQKIYEIIWSVLMSFCYLRRFSWWSTLKTYFDK